jgi:hypothetical protein
VALTQLRNLLAGTRPAGPGNQDANSVRRRRSDDPHAQQHRGRGRGRHLAGHRASGRGSLGRGTIRARLDRAHRAGEDYNNRVRAGLSGDSRYGEAATTISQVRPVGRPTAGADHYDAAGGLIPPWSGSGGS